MITRVLRRTAAAALCVGLSSTACGYTGVNSLPLPGTVATGADSVIYHVQMANVSTLESNSPVMVSDVVVGSVGKMSVSNWHADVVVRVRPGVVVPANAVATIGQTSLLGSMHLALDPPLGQTPAGRLDPGSTIALDKSSTYPSTEQTLSALSAVVNGGGLGQIGDFIHTMSTALSGREPEIRQLMSRLDAFVGTVDGQRDRFALAITELNRLTGTLADQRRDITEALRTIPPALDVLLRERARLVTAFQKLGQFSDTTSALVHSAQADLVRNLTNLEPTIKSLADVGPQLDTILAYLPTFPLSQNLIDRGLRGDYMNIFAGLDITIPRLKRSLFLGTRWGDPNAQLVPAPGEPFHLDYTYQPLAAGVAPAPQSGPSAPPPADQPLLPVTPPAGTTPSPSLADPVFAGPYAPGATGGGN